MPGKTMDFLLTAKLDLAAAKRFFAQALRGQGIPEKVTIDKSGTDQAGLDAMNKDHAVPIIIRQIKYLNNIVEQDHRAVKRLTRPMLGFKSFHSAKRVLAGIELMRMIRKGSGR